ncbi:MULTISPECIES: DUF4834 family protein [Olleya]|uniref:Uncharacterized protein DUF4834 n=1 Tax=Olleya aquimaris TaxID=639310 RepID=A0A327RJS9_9FLAO|nr:MULTISPECIES: DUF4834 family protein [Olleya]RAJ16242.1 uncharacterized protein DUF4834 [Olleya aquimaris]WGD34422.1 DUF4834 family protein [Olleya sp. YS]
MGLLRTILIIALIYYGIKILSRLFAPMLFKYAAKKAEERFGGAFNQHRQEPIQKEGEISIDKMPENKSSNKNVGEYVDYEEIE